MMHRASSALFRVAQTVVTNKNLPSAIISSSSLNKNNVRQYSHEKVETPEEFDQRWIKFFQRPEMDEWWLHKGMTEVFQADAMPEPVIMIEALKAARKVNDYAAAVRFLEIMHFKCGRRVKEVWPYVMQEIQPTLDELGISTPAQMGYDKPEYFIPDESWWPKEYYDIYKIKPFPY